MKTVYSLLAGVCAALLLAACGGGGGDGITRLTGNSGLGMPGITSGVSILGETNPLGTNAPQVAAAVLNGVIAVNGSAKSTSSATPLITGVAVNASTGQFSLAGVVLDQLARVSELRNAPATSGIVGVGIGLNVNCSGGGTATLLSGTSVQDPNFAVLQDGDRLVVSFFLCNETGVVLDGVLDLTVADTGSGTFDGTAPYTVTLDVTFKALRAQDGAEYYYANGEMRLVLHDDGLGFTSTTLTPIPGGPIGYLDTSYNDHDQLLTNFSLYGDANSNSGVFLLDLNGTVESRDIDGTVSFATTAKFSGDTNISSDPASGILLVDSVMDASQLRLTAQSDAITVTIEVMPDGAMVFDPALTPDWTWSQLRAIPAI